MTRKLAVVASGVLVLHVIDIFILGTRPAGSILSNSLQILASWIAATTCFLTLRRTRGLSRPFWLLAGCGVASWGMANIIWMFYENWLQISPPSASIILFDLPAGFYAMALFLNEENDSSRLDAEKLLDFLQVGIVICFLYFDLVYVPALRMSERDGLLRETLSVNLEIIVLVFLALVRAQSVRTAQLRSLYRGLTVYLVIYAVCGSFADYSLVYKNTPTGTWIDLAWTVPSLVLALFAARWQRPQETPANTLPKRSILGGLVVRNLMIASVPLLVVVMAARLTKEWPLIGYSTIILSAGCYAARLLISQSRQLQAMDALQHSVSLQRATLESTTDGILVVDREGHVVDFNQRFQELWRIPRELATERNDETLLQFVLDGLADNEQFLERVKHLYAHPEEDSFDVLHFKDGRTLERYSRPQVVGAAIVGRVWSFRDVTARIEVERKRLEAEKALRASEKKFSIAFQQSPEPIGLSAADDSGYLDVNESFLRLFEMTREEVMGKTSLELGIWNSATERLAILAKIRESGRVRAFEAKLRSKTGRNYSILISADLVELDGKSCILSTSYNVTERERAQNEISAWKKRYDAAVLASGLILYDWNPATNQVTFGGNVKEILGYSIEAMEKGETKWREIVHPDDLERYRKEVDRDLAAKKPSHLEYRMRRKDGIYITVNDDGYPVLDGAGNVEGIVGFVGDVTEQRMLEAQLRQSQKMEAVGQLAGGVAHDFNNLLGIIIGYSDLILSSLERHDPLTAQMEEIRKAGKRGASLTQQLLAFSRKQVLEPRSVDLNSVLADTTTMLRRTIGEDIDLITLPGPSLDLVKIDPGQLEQVLLNLVVNARDAMPRGGILTIATANIEIRAEEESPASEVPPGRYVRLSVSDNGTGMNENVRMRIFEPFFTTKEKGKGTGLGLPMVYGIVKQSGGFTTVSSEPGQGSTFKIYLPSCDEPSITSATASDAPAVSRGSETILLVEDEGPLRKFVRNCLERNGYKVLEASNGSDALKQCEQNASGIHLMLTDVIMPNMSGRELTDRVVSLRPTIKVLYMSGHTDDAMVQHGVLSHGAGFLQKPFGQLELARKVRAVLDKQ